MALPTTSGRRRRVTHIYGLPLPSSRFGVASVLAVAGTGRLPAMLRGLRASTVRPAADLDALARDAHWALQQMDLLADAL